MKKIIIGFAIFFLASCTGRPLTPEDQISTRCSSAGFTGDEYAKCVNSAWAAYKDEVKKNQEEYEKQQKENAKAAETRRKEMLNADREQCQAFGFKKDTDAFASCMMKIAQARSDAQARQQERFEQQQEAYQRWQASQPTMADAATATSINAQSFLAPNLYRPVTPEDVAAHRMNPNIPLPSPPPAPAPTHTSCYRLGDTVQCDTQ